MREKENLTLLGNQQTEYRMDYDPSVLEAFQNKHPENDYFVKFNCPEFTSLCPITGQPDFATITISYVPDERLVESKSLKLYLFSFRNHGDFHEDVINIIMKDLVKLLEPKYIEVWGKFLPRGGLSIDPYCNYGKPGTNWEQVAWNRMSNHDMFPEKIDNSMSGLQRTLINVINSSLVILRYFSKHFYVIMKTELSQEKIVREKIYGHTIYKTIINNR